MGQKAKQTKIQCDNPLGENSVLGALDEPTVPQGVTGHTSQATRPSAVLNRKVGGRGVFLIY